ncbi:MAG: response regulator [Nitrospiraceae bacterium]|jgi:PAS domain S-box-containing protein|nr:response regulator [Nitrospiraceae bacterium]
MMNVLIVDDQEENRYLLESLLKGHGYAVQSAANGAEALEQLKSGVIDLIISDILMPVMDGFELCRKVKTDEAFRHIPFIVYTATYTGPKDEEFALKIGADRFIVKPCEPDVLMETVQGVAALSKDCKKPVQVQLQDEEVFKLYNERLVRKLEQKMLELEEESKALRDAEHALRISERKYRRLHESMTDGFVYVDMQGHILETNESYRKMLGYPEEELTRLTYRDLTPEKWHAFEEGIVQEQVLLKGYSDVYEKEYRKKDGTIFPVELRTFLLCNDAGESEGMWAIVRDISERKKAEQTQKTLEAQLHQAQKLETVGRLAGGVAHDFNNMLAIIFIAVEMIRNALDEASPILTFVRDIDYAAKRARDITRQLLAFSRKQMISPRPCDMNELIADMEKSLARLIGEDIELRFVPQQDLGQVRIDPTQVDQILVNLAVNARDAMPQGGKLTIETANIDIGEEFGREHVGFTPGRYVRLVVSDTGCGMDKETLEHIFEPFYTTKEEGKGTGLGLATIYGIVKQNQGFIDVYSEVGFGTSFKIYLPRMADAGESVVAEQDITVASTGRGSILIVEDDEVLCRSARTILESLGYVVTSAMTPSEALTIVKQRKDRIDLLITDVVMPGMSGVQLADQISSLHPAIKVLYMSGYTAEAIVHRGVLDEGIHFIQKPFRTGDLATKIRELLD